MGTTSSKSSIAAVVAPDREALIRLAREVGAHAYVNRFAKDEPAFAFGIERLERFVSLVLTARQPAAFSGAGPHAWAMVDARGEIIQTCEVRELLALPELCDRHYPEHAPHSVEPLVLAASPAAAPQIDVNEAMRLADRYATALFGDPSGARKTLEQYLRGGAKGDDGADQS
jgi:hypothetical protein